MDRNNITALGFPFRSVATKATESKIRGQVDHSKHNGTEANLLESTVRWKRWLSTWETANLAATFVLEFRISGCVDEG